MSDVVIKAERISKVFKKGAVKNIWHSLFKKDNRNNTFYALKDISFEVKKGETLGIIGPNGAGKSTLLKILCGVTDPTSGSLTVEGRVAPLIEVGAGFHQELTGTENIYLNGIIMGLSKKEVDRKYKDIVDFAELWDFIDTPVKKYSSGMFVRLGFSVAVHTEPDILLVDEVLSVGDMRFQRKCLDKLECSKKSGLTTIFVSHNLHAISGLCKNSFFLVDGKVTDKGSTEKVINSYELYVANLEKNNAESISTLHQEEFLYKEIEITNVCFKDKYGNIRNKFNSDESMTVRVEYFAPKIFENPVFGIGAYRDDGVTCCFSRTKYEGITINKINGKGSFEVEIDPIQLHSGVYVFGISIFDQNLTLPLVVRKKDKFFVESNIPNTGDNVGFYKPITKWKFQNNS